MRPMPLCDSLPENAVLAGGPTHGSWPTLLVVDPDADMLQTLVCFFEKRGFHVAATTALSEAQTFFLRRKHWTLVLTEYHLPDGTGVDLCTWVQQQAGAAVPCLLMSGSPNAATLCAGHEYLAKPFPLAQLEARVHALLGRAKS